MGLQIRQKLSSLGPIFAFDAPSPTGSWGESKYGKPVLDRVLTPDTPLDEAAKCALVSMDSTLKSNLSVGLPLDLVVYEADRFTTDKIVCIDENNPYFRMLHDSWGQKLRAVFDSIEDPAWDGGSDRGAHPGEPGAQQAAQEDHQFPGQADLSLHTRLTALMAKPHRFSRTATAFRLAPTVLFKHLRQRGLEVSAVDRFGHDAAIPGHQQLAAPGAATGRLCRAAGARFGRARCFWWGIRWAAF
jgi:hypothetical protein